MTELTTAMRTRYEGLRARYRTNPESARIRKCVRTTPTDGADPFHSVVIPENLASPDQPYEVAWRTGVDQAVGGLHDAPNPGEVLCGALAACFDGTLRMLAGLLDVELQEVTVEASAEVDIRGALGLSTDARVGLDAMRLDVKVRPAPGVPESAATALLEAAERYCITLDTLRSGVPVTLAIQPDLLDTTQALG